MNFCFFIFNSHIKLNSINKVEIIDKLCSWNDYILTFQGTTNVKNLCSELLKLRDVKDYYDITNLLHIIDELIIELEQQKILYPEYSGYIEDILTNVMRSKSYLLSL